MIKKQIFSSLIIRVICGSFLMVALSVASAKEFRLASGVPPLHPAHDPLYTEFSDLLVENSDGNLSGTLLGTEVTTLGNMRASIRSGVVEIGLFLPSYFPADLPNFNLIGDLALLGSDGQITGAAATEYMLTCGDCQSEFSKLDTVYVSTHANPYSLLSNKAVTSVDDLEGMRIRVATPQHARWVEAMGAKPVSLKTGEVFEALSQGIIDATIASISDLISFNLSEVVSHITLLDMGTFHSTSNHTIRSDTWQNLSDEDRVAVIKSSFKASILTNYRWAEMVEQGKSIAKEEGIQMHEPSDELVNITRQFKEEDLINASVNAKERFGVTNAEEKVKRFQELMEKWELLINDTDRSVDAIARLYENEILPKIDVSSIGQ